MQGHFIKLLQSVWDEVSCFFSVTFLFEVKPTKLNGVSTSNYNVSEKSMALNPNSQTKSNSQLIH